MREVRECAGITPAQFRDEIVAAARPVVFRGLARDWPAVEARDILGYLRTFVEKGVAAHRCDLLVGPPTISGRFFYDDAMSGFNFTREPVTLGEAFDRMDALRDIADPASIAVQSVPIAEALPGFAAANPTELVPTATAPPRLWAGNRTVTALHFDMMDNLAIAVAGHRRFMLLPPGQTPNVYMGPFEFTPAATPVALVDPEAPDLARFPRFAAAIDQIQTTVLAPGDAIYIPYLWWHQVRSLDAVAVLVNHWWNASAALPGLAPIDALIHALLAFAPLPDVHRAAWRAMFETVAFGPEPVHIPVKRRGIRGKLMPDVRDRLRRQIGALMTTKQPD